MFTENFNPIFFFPALLVLMLSIGFHEYAHAKVADLCGDPTPAFYGRVTLNPLNHIDPMGSIMMVFTLLAGFGLGWGKAVPINPSKMRNPRWDALWTTLAGPICNLLQATIYAIILRGLLMGGLFSQQIMDNESSFRATNIIGVFLVMGISINVLLCLFNLLPLGPLDGHWIVGAFMPDKMRHYWYKFSRSYGTIIFIAIVLIGQKNPQYDLVGWVMRTIGSPIIAFLLGIQ